MPSVRMKNSSMGFLGEKKGLGICQKSAMISKRSPSHVSLSHLTEEHDTCTQSCKTVSSSDEEALHSTGVMECVDVPKLFPGEDIQSQQQSELLVAEASPTRMDMSMDSTSTNFEIIFCPVVNELADHNGADNHSEEGSNNNSEQPDNSAADESDGNNGGLLDYQSCNVSDFYISDVVFAGLQFDGSVIGVDTAESNVPEYITSESTQLLDPSEEYLSLPFLHETLCPSPTSKVQQPAEAAKLQSYDSSLFSVIHQMRPGEQGPDLDTYLNLDHTELTDSLSFIRNLPDLSDATPTCRPTIFQKESEKRKPVTLVLDLDETLVHSTMEHCESTDFTFTVLFNMKEHTVYVKRRPHLHTFLERVAEMFEVFVFTASQSIYAEQLLNILDPEGKIFSGRAYRESCIFSEGIYTKDLTVLGLDLAKVFIIDNSPQVFRLQVNNGIPIKSWFDDPSDNELISLIPFLETLADVDDVRPIIANRFGNKE